MKSVAEQMVFFAKSPLLSCRPFVEWRGLNSLSFHSDVDVIFDLLDSGEWMDVLNSSSSLPMTAQPMEIKFQLLARSIRTIGGVPIVTDEQLEEYAQEIRNLASAEPFRRQYQDLDDPVRIAPGIRVQYLVRTIRKWPLHVVNAMFEAYSAERDKFLESLRREVGNLSGASQAESVGKSPSKQDSPPLSGPGVTVD
jgi:hypothetical protein